MTTTQKIESLRDFLRINEVWLGPDSPQLAEARYELLCALRRAAAERRLASTPKPATIKAKRESKGAIPLHFLHPNAELSAIIRPR